jgi:hypothetical protein
MRVNSTYVVQLVGKVSRAEQTEKVEDGDQSQGDLSWAKVVWQKVLSITSSELAKGTSKSSLCASTSDELAVVALEVDGISQHDSRPNGNPEV